LVLLNHQYTKFLFALPVRNNTTPSIEITKILIKDVNGYLGSLSINLKINNFRADGDSKFEKMIENNDRVETKKLGKIIYKRNIFFEYLECECITLYLNSSPFLNKNRVVDNLKNYGPGNILLIHLDFAKTGSKIIKKQRTFNKLAKFISYDFGNVKCHVYNVIKKHIKNPITIPIYYTKYIAENERSIPQKYKELPGSVKN
jgi:hypothetical protein